MTGDRLLWWFGQVQSGGPADEAARWLGLGCAVAFALLLLRVLVWYQRTFLQDARTELAELRLMVASLEDDHQECLGRNRALEDTVAILGRRLEQAEYTAQVTRRQMAEAIELGPPRAEHTRRDDGDGGTVHGHET